MGGCINFGGGGGEFEKNCKMGGGGVAPTMWNPALWNLFKDKSFYDSILIDQGFTFKCMTH